MQNSQLPLNQQKVSSPYQEIAKKQLYRLVNPDADNKFDQRMLKDPEEKEYLLCLLMNYPEDIAYEWNLIRGRKRTYEFIKENIEEIDFEESFVLTEGVILQDRKTIYAFMKHCQAIFNDGFEIDDYVDHPMDTSSTTRVVDGSFTDLLEQRQTLTMNELMNSHSKRDV